MGADGEWTTGTLRCDGAGCGVRYPIRDGVPRLVAPGRLSRVERRTQERFGYQWTRFGKEAERFEANFLNYIAPVSREFFSGKVGLDAGCGFGRHIYQAARFGAEMVGLDLSAAVDTARQATRDIPQVHLVQGDLLAPPLAPGSFDFVCSIGVLHHLPEPQRGFVSIARLVKPGGLVMVWVYSTSRRWTNRALEAVRRWTTRLGPRTLHLLSWLAAVCDWWLAIQPYRWLRRAPWVGGMVERVAPERVKLYATYPFGVCLADWFDRLAAPIRHYYDEPALRRWADAVGLREVRITPTGKYGWRLHGVVPGRQAASPHRMAGDEATSRKGCGETATATIRCDKGV